MADVVVTQEDREAAAHWLGYSSFQSAVRLGEEMSSLSLAHLLARHRIAARKQALEEAVAALDAELPTMIGAYAKSIMRTAANIVRAIGDKP